MLIRTSVFNLFGDWFSNRQPATSCRLPISTCFFFKKNGNSRVGGNVADRIGFR